MSAPFSNGTDGAIFQENRCLRCAHWDHEVEVPCVEFTPAFMNEWPEIFYRVPVTTTNLVGVECRKFEAKR